MPRSDELTVLLAAEEEALAHAIVTSVLALAVQLQEAAELLIGRLFPDLPDESEL